MVLQTITDLDDDVYPGVQEYARCQSKAFMKGFVGFIAGGAAGWTGSIYARQRFAKFTSSHTVSAIAGGAIVCGYLAASIASRDCQKNWVRTAQAAGYTDDIITKSHRTVTQPSSVTEATNQSNTSSAIGVHGGGQDEGDGPVSRETKYGDTMD